MKSLFVYGTLMFPEIQRKIIGRCPKKQRATLHGYARYKIKDANYPAAIPEPESVIQGYVLFELTDEELKRIDQYEGAEYKRIPVSVSLEDGTSFETFAYILKEEFRDEIIPVHWSADDFDRNSSCPSQDY